MSRLLSLLLMLSSSMLPAQNPASPTTLAELRDRFRPLLLFAPKPDDPALLAQMHRLKDAAPGLKERDILVIAVPFNNPSPTDVSLTPAEALGARRRFHVAPDEFVAVLIGKDGGEKLRSRSPVSFSRLRETVDAMPMRREEMRRSPGP